MKIRNGFVSNSSSSSFIIAGIMVSEGDPLWSALRDEDGDEVDTGVADLDLFRPEYGEDEAVVGVYVCSSDRGCIEELDLTKLQNSLATAKEALERVKRDLKLDIDLDSIKLYTIGE